MREAGYEVQVAMPVIEETLEVNMVRYFATGVCAYCNKTVVAVSPTDGNEAVRLLRLAHKQNLGHYFGGSLKLRTVR